MIHIKTMQLGPVMTNAYLVADEANLEAAVIDPAWDGDLILAEAEAQGWQIRHIWVTHAHFDHMGGAGAIVDGLDNPPEVALHPKDRLLWRAKGGAPFFGVQFESSTQPTKELAHGQILKLGENTVEVRHAPGHTKGHVMFYFKEAGALFSGDVIFQGSVGRTDLPGGSWDVLLNSIQTQVLSLPDEVRIYSGHGPATTVGHERRSNPFVLYG
jgi:glyoxylase-like metal-dependent hydrolase (beta-lactamase superfamily II)